MHILRSSALLCGLALVACGGSSSNPPDAPPGGMTADAAKPDAAPSGPCGGIDEKGVCSTSTQLRVCVTPSGGGAPKLEVHDCRQGETCHIVDDKAACILTAECLEGATQCTSGTAIRTCTGGHWVASTCPKSCVPSPLGDACGLDATTKAFTGTLQYQARGPNDPNQPTDWSALGTVAGQGFLVVSARIAGSDVTVIDTTTTAVGGATPGSFSVQVPSAPTANDYIVFLAAGTTTDPVTKQLRIQFAVIDPNLDAAAQPYDVGTVGTAPSIWKWSGKVSELTSGGTITIGEQNFSGAARVFDVARYVHGSDAQRFPGKAQVPLAIWIGVGVGWSCGACQGAFPTTQFGTDFGAQMFLGGGDDQEYWSDAVTAHELGHWTMGTYGFIVGEGGQHCIGVPDAPGLGWSEGWATWFSSDAREDPLYYDKQQGSFFWLDLSQRTGYAWVRPDAGDGLLQDIDENEISAMMWSLSSTQGLGHAPLDTALASKRMTAPTFARGYTRHTWDVDNTCHRVNIADSGESTTCFADFLDALRCGGVSAAKIDVATEPGTHYPYPSGAPLCQ